LLFKHLAELGHAAGWHAGLAFAALAGVVIAIPAAANANLPTLKPVVLHAPKPVAPPAPPPAPPAPAFSFVDPLPGRDIGSPFGLRELPWEARGRLHEGVDIAAPTGEAVHATLPGVVARTGVSQSYGRFVEVRHGDGLTSFYAHLKAAAARMRAGREIAADQVVGYVGDTGHSTGPHLHFEIRRNGAPLNPAMFIDQQFATAANLPLRKAAAVGRVVRIAQVSGTPAAFRPRVRHGRVHAVIPGAAPATPASPLPYGVATG
jgi:murein DD-endopeptidase MepM/ murein hydrolase activator NlpD